MARWRTLLALVPALLLFLCGAEPPREATPPLTPAQAVHSALRSNLKTVRDWLDDKDLASAAQSAQGLVALAHLYTRQGSDPAWQARASALADSCSRLAAACRSKDAARCATLAADCDRLLDELAKATPGPRLAEAPFKPHGSTKTWMLLLDGAYSDAKTADSGRELEQLTASIAEEMNAVQHLRSDARWRKTSQEVRAAALGVAEKARTKDLATARASLKTVYTSCEACHKTFTR